MFIRWVSGESLHVFAEIFCVKKPVVALKREYFVASCLDCAGLVNVDVSGRYSYYSLAWGEKVFDDRCVGLGTSGHEVYCGVWTAYFASD